MEQPVSILDYATASTGAPRPTPPLVHRCVRTGLITSALFCASTGAWAEANWPHVSNWDFEKQFCYELLQNASWVAGATFILGLIWWLTNNWYRRSVVVNAALLACPIMYFYFGVPRL